MTPHKPPTLSTGKAAEALNVDRKTILNWIDAEKIKAIEEKVGDRTYYRIPLSEVARIRAAKTGPLPKKTPAQPVEG